MKRGIVVLAQLVHPERKVENIDIFDFVRQKTLLTEDASDVRHFYEKFGFTSCDKGSSVAFYKEF